MMSAVPLPFKRNQKKKRHSCASPTARCWLRRLRISHGSWAALGSCFFHFLHRYLVRDVMSRMGYSCPETGGLASKTAYWPDVICKGAAVPSAEQEWMFASAPPRRLAVRDLDTVKKEITVSRPARRYTKTGSAQLCLHFKCAPGE